MAGKADNIVAGLGGIENIETVRGCVTRLRTEVGDAALVDVAALKNSGARDVVRMGTSLQIVLGDDAALIAAEIQTRM
jgi:PTS system N-acetylglucosamine-specific IIB component